MIRNKRKRQHIRYMYKRINELHNSIFKHAIHGLIKQNDILLYKKYNSRLILLEF